MADNPLRTKQIGDHGVVGDLHTVALVGADGSIDWCCFPRFDSPSIFAAILDEEKGGFFRIQPTEEVRGRQLYLPDSNILLTRFLHSDGVGELLDFMPIVSDEPGEHPGSHTIIRRITVVRGRLTFRLECQPRFDYGRAEHRTRITRGDALFESDHMVVGLQSPVELVKHDRGARAEFTLSAGETVHFLLRHVTSEDVNEALEHPPDPEVLFRETAAFWRSWIAGSRYHGRWREMVHRSALVLKLLAYSPTGATVAAPTTSLPEEIGGSRNWDYRFSWIRDSAFTLYGLLRIGFTEEAGRYMDFLNERILEVDRDGALQPVYGIDGRKDMDEEELPHLSGYRDSRPVRIGNAAAGQLQLDIYGELMDSVYLYNKYGRPIGYDTWNHLVHMLNWVCDHWREPDDGIWEVRGGRRHFVFSKMLSWVALDRGIRLASKRSFPAPHERWTEERDKIYLEVMDKGWNEEIGAFTQYYGSDALDASLLLMPLVFFMSPHDPRMLSTLDRIMEHLVSDSLVYRYRSEKAAAEGVGGNEGTFCLCSFWLVEALTRAGRLDEARLIFEKMLSYANPLGLYSEQIAPTGDQLGNFPQAFTHMALISAAYNLDRALGALP
jgi:GH15 family glucan-1,4-alpha-glucosidase